MKIIFGAEVKLIEMLRQATVSDAPAIAEIYNYYVERTAFTFEEIPLTADQMTARMRAVLPRFPWLVSERENQIVGYAYARPYHQRSAFRFTVENAVYIRRGFTGQGAGAELLAELLARLPREIHAVIACLGLPNEPSVKLHEKFGFKPVGQLREVGYKFGEWRDTGDWELLITHC